MASYSSIKSQVLRASGAIVRGQAVKLSADDTVTAASANTDKCVGISQEAADDGKLVEFALPGSGGVALAGESIARGALLVAGAGGKLFQTNADGDRVIAMAKQAAVLNDLFEVEVLVAVATGADQ